MEGSTAILRDEEWILRNRGWLVSAAQFPRGVRVEFDWEWTEGEGTYSDILTVGLATSGRPGNKTWTREIQDGLRLLFAPHPAPGNIVIRDTKTEKQLARTWGPRLAKSNELHVRIDYYGEEVRIHLNHSDEPSLLGSVPREMTFQRVAIYNRERVAGIDKESRLRNLQLTPLPEPPT